MLAVLSNGHKLGLALVGGTFILFALVSSFLLPRRDPNFPGRNLFWFVAAAVGLFAAMLAAVFVFGKEPAEGHAAEPAAKKPAAHVGGSLARLAISETEFKIQLPATKMAPATVDVQVTNKGKTIHNLVIKGPGVSKSTKDLNPGGQDSVQVQLKAGMYELYCSIPGHKELGMDAKLTVS
ncbi:MAG TPA: plastocyanin/azurin family copper-binding protein [Gaiellaceae bacterium]